MPMCVEDGVCEATLNKVGRHSVLNFLLVGLACWVLFCARSCFKVRSFTPQLFLVGKIRKRSTAQTAHEHTNKTLACEQFICFVSASVCLCLASSCFHHAHACLGLCARECVQRNALYRLHVSTLINVNLCCSIFSRVQTFCPCCVPRPY